MCKGVALTRDCFVFKAASCHVTSHLCFVESTLVLSTHVLLWHPSTFFSITTNGFCNWNDCKWMVGCRSSKKEWSGCPSRHLKRACGLPLLQTNGKSLIAPSYTVICSLSCHNLELGLKSYIHHSVIGIRLAFVHCHLSHSRAQY